MSTRSRTSLAFVAVAMGCSSAAAPNVRRDGGASVDLWIPWDGAAADVAGMKDIEPQDGSASDSDTADVAGTVDVRDDAADAVDAAGFDAMGSTDSSTVAECVGASDGGLTRACYTGSEATAGVGVCRAGQEFCADDGWQGTCVGEVLPVPETCDGRDEDCDGVADEGSLCNDGDPCTRDVCMGVSGCRRSELNGPSCGSDRWCYRGTCSTRFVDTRGGTMVDLSTGLEWQRVGWGRNFGAPGNRPQYDCNGCSSLQDTAMLPGRGWSKPTSVQLNSLRARETCMPAILTFSDPFSASLLVGHWSQDSFDGCSPLPIRYWSCAGAICDGNANNAAACRCVRTWLP